MTGVELWGVFFAYGVGQQYAGLLDKMIAARVEIKMARGLLQTTSRDENERARFRPRRMFRMDMGHSLIVAGDEGAIAIAISIAITRNLLAASDPAGKIVNVTGLTREEVESLRVSD